VEAEAGEAQLNCWTRAQAAEAEVEKPIARLHTIATRTLSIATAPTSIYETMSTLGERT
jgi:hypothetical protein